ncbi:ras guanine nucleotide exchange factor P-like [Copidosoma floridanum]|uniref:ras guanine nucleotide exchange factor P-like n=1 Tax=Copidosoma floridanum TaxID=29053 RepID=UPI0006C9BB5F|nr:ras guanine nucleotide exchange factor P-like [Copidosoma floridanum]
MNRRLRSMRKTARASTKCSPVLFEDEEMSTSSPDEVRPTHKPTTPRSKSLLAGHSTPIRAKKKIDASDSPELNYNETNESPIEPLTQHPPNEVGWDYQRPLMKEDGSGSLTSLEINKTPKRSAALLAKKRNSNSPLLHKPLKKKLIQEEQRENLAGFMEELRAIEMKAKLFGEMNVDDRKIEDHVESQLVIDVDSETSGDSDIKLRVSADESIGKKPSPTVNKNTDEFMDDSIEDMLVMCSQQVEAEEFGIQAAPSAIQSSTSTLRFIQAPQVCSTGSEKPLKTGAKENCQPLNNNTKVNESLDKNSSSGKGDSNSLEIPDDSFDDFMVEFDDKDFCQNSETETVISNVHKPRKNSTPVVTTSKSSITQNKFFQHKNSVCIKQTKIISSNSSCNIPVTSSASIQNKVVNTNANFGYLNQNYVKNYNSSGFISQTQSSNNSDNNNETRLFKSKSYSDSHFLNQSNSVKNSTTKSVITQKPENKSLVEQSKSSSNSDVKSWRRVQSSSSLSESSVNKNSQQLSNRETSNSEGSLPLSTPAEIERKRQEAIMKREARLRMRLNSVTIQNRPMYNTTKR